MRYSILGFNQKQVIAVTKEVEGKTYRLDTVDLLIIKEMADFMNRTGVVKHSVNDKDFFWISYTLILEDLPILDMKKGALKARIEKMCLLGVLEKEIVTTSYGLMSVFRLGDVYEKMIYTEGGSQNFDRGSQKINMGSQNNDRGLSKNCKHNTNNTNNSITNTHIPTNVGTAHAQEQTQKSAQLNTESSELDSINQSVAADGTPYGNFLKWLADNTPYCYKNLTLPTEAQFTRLKDRYGSKKVVEVARQIENRKDLRKKYANLYLTLNNWLKREENEKTNK